MSALGSSSFTCLGTTANLARRACAEQTKRI
jgi:hypothetical protein